MGHALATIVQAFIYISIVEVDAPTLVLLIVLSILGARLGAGVVAQWPRRRVQFGMGFALLAAAGLFVFKNLDEMQGSCAFLMPIAGAKFVRVGSYSAGAALGLAVGGIPAVLIAAFIVKSLPLTVLRWLVVVVVLYSSLMMIRSWSVARPPAEW